MSDIAVRVEHLSKRYRIGEGKRYDTLRDTIADCFAGPLGWLGGGKKPAVENGASHPASLPQFTVGNSHYQFIWALKDVSFDIKRGEVVGVIGRNGAGKSTLLKILSRITEPSEGEARIYGRVGSLLEVGTGFHSELTGRENIYLNGAILGMKKKEIDNNFDEIVAFAEIEKVIDTSVKHYSSGMYMRLAFSVAAHLQPAILIVDEVLAVGDAGFQKKCLGKMGEVAKQGRTVLFVSHNMGVIGVLCQKVVLLEHGQAIEMGETARVVEAYLRQQNGQGRIDESWGRADSDILKKQQTVDFTFTDIKLLNPKRPELGARTGDPFIIRIMYSAKRQFVSPVFWLSMKDIYGQEIFRLSTMPISGYPVEELYQSGCVELLIEDLPLVGGHYYLDVAFARERLEFIVKLENVVQLNVQPQDIYESGFLLERSQGIIAVKHRWNHRANDHVA